MKWRIILLSLPVALLCAYGGVVAQQGPQAAYATAQDATRALADARTQGEAARQRAEALEANSRRTMADADRIAGQSAALAARIQQSEAEIATNEARIILIERQREELRALLDERQRPLVQLTAALQRLTSTPPLFALLRPGSLQDAVYMRAVLETILPEVRQRTAGVRAEIRHGRALQQQAWQASGQLRASERRLAERRTQLAGLEVGQRLASQQVGNEANREAERALGLAEQARDLSGLLEQLNSAANLRDQLAALPGPVPRPLQVLAVQAPVPATVALTLPSARPPSGYLLPVTGRLMAGFGDDAPGRPRSRGLSFATGSNALAVAPAGGRVAFAGPYQGYGNIVIIEHGGGWISLVAGLAGLNARVGQQLVAGSPIGSAGAVRPIVTLELRHDGVPVNPLDFI